MDINQNQTNISLVDSKSAGFSALQKVDGKQVKENVLEFNKAKALSESKQAEKKLDSTETETETEDLSLVVAKINEQVQSVQRDLVFSVDQESGREVVTIRDSNSDKVIRQIPSEEMLELARNLNEQIGVDKDVKALNLFRSIA